MTSNLDEHEIQLLLVALRYWRAHRSEGGTRRTDPRLTPDSVDLLIAKLTHLAPAMRHDSRQQALFDEDQSNPHSGHPTAGGSSSKHPHRR